jgi:antitoxin (DNA-binding transcriptional repressor) of toxin-antitoxin stability system
VATFHISETEAVRDFAAVMARVRAGIEVVIESADLPVAVVHTVNPPSRTIEECLAMLAESSSAVMDEGFARDVEAAIQAHRDPLDAPAWD